MDELRKISPRLSLQTKILFTRAFQEAAWSQLRDKLEMSLSKKKISSTPSKRIGKDQLPHGELERYQILEICKEVKHVVISGGVASNLALRKS